MHVAQREISRRTLAIALLTLVGAVAVELLTIAPAQAVNQACPDAAGRMQHPTVKGTTLDDTLHLTSIPPTTGGADVIQGLRGNDVIDAAGGHDIICGDNVQILVGGDDTIFGGSGNDVVNASYGHDVIDGGRGVDTYVVNGGDQPADVQLDADQGSCDPGYVEIANDGFGSTDCLRGIENVTVISGFNDFVQGNAKANVIISRLDPTTLLPYASGADMLQGRGGNDLIKSNEGTDGSVDLVDGGPGIDRCVKDPQDSQADCER